jgi:DNA-binding NtrC family response regulator
MRKILLIDNSRHNADRFRSLLETDELVIEWLDSSTRATQAITADGQEIAAVIIFMEIPGPPFAFELLLHCRQVLPSVPVIVVSSALNAALATRAFSLGARDFLEMPLDAERVKSCLHSLIADQDPSSPVVAELNKTILGKSPVLLATLKQIAKVISHPDLRVLLIGESGTGKERVAQEIHHLGPDKSAPCVAVNVGEIPPTLIESQLFGHEKGAFTGADQQHIGYLEQAGNGTLFLDEIGDLDLSLQVKLLRVIQEKTFRRLKGTRILAFQARLVCATNRDLAVAVRQGEFRRDLFHRIAEVVIHVPPLRERKGDVDLLLNHFLGRYGGSQPVRFARETLTILRSYTFPGNVRELENLIKAALIDCEGGPILPQHLPLKSMDVFLASEAPIQPSSAEPVPASSQKAENGTAQPPVLTTAPSQVWQRLFDELVQALPNNWLDLPYKEVTAQYERAFDRVYLNHVMERHRHKVSRAAKATGIDRKTFERHLKDAGLLPLVDEDESNGE